MRRLVTFSAALLVAGSAWAGPWGVYSESISSAYYMDYLDMRKDSVAGQPGAGDSEGARPHGRKPDRARTEEVERPFRNPMHDGSILNDVGHRL